MESQYVYTPNSMYKIYIRKDISIYFIKIRFTDYALLTSVNKINSLEIHVSLQKLNVTLNKIVMKSSTSDSKICLP